MLTDDSAKLCKDDHGAPILFVRSGFDLKDTTCISILKHWKSVLSSLYPFKSINLMLHFPFSILFLFVFHFTFHFPFHSQKCWNNILLFMIQLTKTNTNVQIQEELCKWCPTHSGALLMIWTKWWHRVCISVHILSDFKSFYFTHIYMAPTFSICSETSFKWTYLNLCLKTAHW